MPMHLKFATGPASLSVIGGRQAGWISVINSGLDERNGQYLLGKQCASLAEIKELVEQIKADLDAIVVEATAKLTAGSAN